MHLPPLDIAALAIFVLAWAFYHFALERGGRKGLNRRMDEFRLQWMHEMAKRDVRVTDASIMASLQNGTAFFASTSLLAKCWRWWNSRIRDRFANARWNWARSWGFVSTDG